MTKAKIKSRIEEALTQAKNSDRREYLETLKKLQDELYFLKTDKNRNIIKIINKQNKINLLKNKLKKHDK